MFESAELVTQLIKNAMMTRVSGEQYCDHVFDHDKNPTLDFCNDYC